ncbi:hypothetical protein [Gayadomonas joobiniege]|uniref:hypothetical protein n=1 Tax=Gayadomonas joobiniege TaxID=1234606 RepID=UPI00036C6176|nr:hypothetical protein [Gayadomonas joobiniege]
MKNIDLSQLILSMGESVEESHKTMKEMKLNVALEELEVTLTMQSELDETSVQNKPAPRDPKKGLRFAHLKPKLKPRVLSRVPNNQNTSVKQEQTGTLTLHALFSVRDYD